MGLYAELDDCEKSETGYLWQTLQLGEGYQGEAKLEVEAGTYRVITTNRLPNGNQFAACTEFDIENGQTKEIQLTLRKAELKDMLEEIPLEEFAVEDEQGIKILGSQKSKREPRCLSGMRLERNQRNIF